MSCRTDPPPVHSPPSRRDAPGFWRRYRAWPRCLSTRDSFERSRRMFLPGALCVQETPPPPLGHVILWLLLALMTAALAWSCAGSVDIVVTAPGRIVPTGQVKVIQAPELATVLTLPVHEGQRVEAGQLLLQLDATDVDADRQDVVSRSLETQLQIAWRQALERWLARGEMVEPSLPDGVTLVDKERMNALLAQQRAEVAASVTRYESDLDANGAERRSAAAALEQAAATLTILRQRVSAFATLMQKQYGSRARYLDMLQQQTQMEHSLPVLAARLDAIRQRAGSITASMDSYVSEVRKRNMVALSQLHTEQAALQQSLRKAIRRQGLRRITAPVTGTVQDLRLHTVGAVVTPAQVLMKIVPEAAAIEVEALLPDRDIGFVREGQNAAIKVNTFNFTRYGLIDATVADISDDVVEDERLGQVFRMRLQLARDRLQVGDRWIKLGPGLSVTAEVMTGRRRLIDFFLSPLLRYRQESIRER